MSTPKTKRRATIGHDPLDALLPPAPPAKTKGKESVPAPAPSPIQGKVRATFHLPAELFDEARDAVVHLSGPPLRLTLAELAARALRAELDRLKQKHNHGQPFPKRQGELKGGRPVGK